MPDDNRMVQSRGFVTAKKFVYHRLDLQPNKVQLCRIGKKLGTRRESFSRLHIIVSHLYVVSRHNDNMCLSIHLDRADTIISEGRDRGLTSLAKSTHVLCTVRRG